MRRDLSFHVSDDEPFGLIRIVNVVKYLMDIGYAVTGYIVVNKKNITIYAITSDTVHLLVFTIPRSNFDGFDVNESQVLSVDLRSVVEKVNGKVDYLRLSRSDEDGPLLTINNDDVPLNVGECATDYDEIMSFLNNIKITYKAKVVMLSRKLLAFTKDIKDYVRLHFNGKGEELIFQDEHFNIEREAYINEDYKVGFKQGMIPSSISTKHPSDMLENILTIMKVSGNLNLYFGRFTPMKISFNIQDSYSGSSFDGGQVKRVGVGYHIAPNTN